MPPVVAAAGVTAGGAIAGAYMQHKSADKASTVQQQQYDQAAQAEKAKQDEETRRYQERWDEFIRQRRDWEARRAQAQQQVNSGGGTRRFAGKTADEINGSPTATAPTYGTTPTMYGMDPRTGKPRTLGDVAMGWNDWGQYGVQ